MAYESEALCILVLYVSDKIVNQCCCQSFIGVRRDIITVMCLNSEGVRHLKVMYHLIGIGG